MGPNVHDNGTPTSYTAAIKCWPEGDHVYIGPTISALADGVCSYLTAFLSCQVVRDECLKGWKFVERNMESSEFGSGYPAGRCVCVCVCVCLPVSIARKACKL